MSQIEDPEPPSDLEQRSVIDKLAQFVARNGPDFERMTMEKQQGNPQFAFLFGGEYSDYYKHKVEELKTTIQQQPPPPQMMPQQPFHPDPMGPPAHPQWGGPPYNRTWDEGGDSWGNAQWPPPPPLPPQGNWGSNWGSQNGPPPLWCRGPYPPNFYPPPPPPPPPQQTPPLTEEDVKRSEVNLKAQYDKIIGEEKPQAVRQCLDKARMDAFISAATALSVNPEEFSGAIQPLIEICTKENIAKGKNWAVELMSRGEAYANLVVNYLLLRAQNMDASFETRLHIVYLINDLLHFLKRHSDVAHFQSALNRIVVPVYSLALEMADEEKKVKLTRVLSLWETNAYLPDDILKNMKEEGVRETFMKEWRADQDKVYAEKIAEVEAEHTTRYEALKKQHDDFADHVHKTLAAAAESEHPDGGPLPFPDFSRYGPPPPPPQGFAGGNGGGWGGGGGKFDPPPCWHGPPPFMTGPPPMPGRGGDRWGRGRGGDMPPYHPDDEFYDGRRGGPPPPHMPYRGGPSRDRYRRDGRFDEPYYNHHHHQDDRPYRGGMQHRRRYEENEEEQHRSGGVDNQELEEEVEQQQQVNPPSEEDLIPKVPFWQLPAGLMHPLIGPKDFDFTPLDPAKLRLLPPEPPSEQLMLALDAYYVQPSHDRPRDPEGWERLGLFEFYRAKEEARNRKESDVSAAVTEEEEEEKSGSASPGDRPKNQGLPQLAYLTAYPKSAIGQAIRTGPAALIATPPPNLGMPKMNAQFAAAAAVAAVNSGAGSGDLQGGASKYPPPGMPASTQPTSAGQAPQSTQLISRASRFTSATRRRSRSRSRSYSRSRSGSRSDSRSSGSRSRSSSRSRSRSRSSRSRSRSPPSDRRYRDRSRSPRSTDGSITTAGFMRRSGGGGGGEQRNNRRGGMGGSYPPPQHPAQWGYDHSLPPPPMMPSYDRRGGPPGQMYPPYGSGGYRGNGYSASSPPPPPPSHSPMGNSQRGAGSYYGSGGGNSYGNANRRGGYQGR